MRCTECGTENPDRAKFCLNCGTKLALVCPQCGVALPTQAKFCFECGTKIGGEPPSAPHPAQPAEESMLERLQSLVPQQFAERLAATRGRIGNERRIVTILFSDIKGSTAIAETLDPEDVMEIMNGAFDFLVTPIYRHEGTLARLMGDAILAFFGAPISHENDPERAVRAALEIVEGARGYAAELERERGIAGFNVRVGINTGLVVVGEVGSDLRMEYTAMGDAINLAARMEQNAPVGGILISHNTYRHVQGIFETEALDPIAVKGKREPVQVYLVKRARPRAFLAPTRGLAGITTAMIGRQSELKTLRDALDLMLMDEERQMVTVVGAAGIGKSRLLYEFSQEMAARPEGFCYFRGRASEERQSIAYGLLRALLTSHFGIQDSDSAEVARNKLVRGLTETFGKGTPDSDQATLRAHFIGQMLGFDFSGSPHVQPVLDDAQQLHDQALSYLITFFEATAADRPTVLFLEDIHWADDSSLDALYHIAQAIGDRPLLIVSLTRATLFEQRPYWGEGELYHTRIDLPPLSKLESRQLVKALLRRVDDVPQQLRDLIVDVAEGNPLYVEELVKVLIEQEVILRPVDTQRAWQVRLDRLAGMKIPPSLTAIFQARLDGLSAQERVTLQRASVVGRVFWNHALARISKVDEGKKAGLLGIDMGAEEIDTTLGQLRAKEMVLRREHSSFADFDEYTFKNTVLRQVTYESVLKRVRRLYHGLVAQWLIEQSGERAGEIVGQIAEQLALAQKIEEAVIYLRRAAEQAAAQFANAEAIRCFSRALGLLGDVRGKDSWVQDQRYALLLGREAAYSLSGKREEQAQDLAALNELVHLIDEDELRAEVSLRYAQYYEAVSDFPAAEAAAEETVALAERVPSPVLRMKGLIDWGLALWRQGKLAEARDRLAHARRLARQHDHRRGEAEALLNLGAVLYQQGACRDAREHWERALALYRELGYRKGQARALSNLAAAHHGTGDLASARTCNREALAIYQDIGDRRGEADALNNLAIIERELGDLEAAEEHGASALALYRVIREAYGEALALDNLALTHHDLGADAVARELCHQALEMERAIGDRLGEGYTLNHLGLAEEQLGDLDAALSAYEEALSIRHELGQEALALDDLAGIGRVLLAQGHLAGAVTHVEDALSWIEASGTEGIEYPLRVLLTSARVLAAAGHIERAQTILEEARARLQAQADLISDEGSRRSFLENVPLHRQVVAGVPPPD